MIWFSRQRLGGGVGRRLCMPIYSGSSDSAFKDKYFVLKKINHKYENVLLFGDVKKLRDTAVELIKGISSSEDNRNEGYANLKIKRYISSEEKKARELEDDMEGDPDSAADNNHLMYSNADVVQNAPSKDRNPKMAKKLSFWQIYSMRVKKSLHLLRPNDFSLILQSFHLYNKDTGVYVSSVKHIEGQIPEMNGVSFCEIEKNNYNDFFKKMMNYLPNVMYELNVRDMNNILSCFHNLELSDTRICDIFYQKILSNLNRVEDTFTLSSLCYIFYKYNFENQYFFECLKRRGLLLLDNFDAGQFYKFVFSLHNKNICLKEIVDKKKNDVLAFLSDYNDEQRLFMGEIFGIK
ncbi:hypothetical protein PCYB_104020 [Plasmodium cynomolgi strain B]|uniref:Uncharacterized protein n=1 Tax=Plasmodium cynomolgi (strain B) TaxID=1120755 RepID=K6VCX6_PLACD|nr:hypothetical protein PCYB_104020 [Plasmodium cynomolgi strain B]GAB67052.1 hypothetical protein PCYB_104020 [Plasmodium cynomolgi strain B]